MSYYSSRNLSSHLEKSTESSVLHTSSQNVRMVRVTAMLITRAAAERAAELVSVFQVYQQITQQYELLPYNVLTLLVRLSKSVRGKIFCFYLLTRVTDINLFKRSQTQTVINLELK